MKPRHIPTALIIAGATVAGVALAVNDRFALKSPTGISFSEVKGYENWQMIASSMPDNASGCGSSPEPGCIKSILGNPVMIQAYKDGFPGNGKVVPDGAMMAKIEWQKRHEAIAYPVTMPGPLMEVAFMLKDSKRFADHNGWGYATLKYDAATDAWTPKPVVADTCHACHTAVKANDFVFTAYPKR